MEIRFEERSKIRAERLLRDKYIKEELQKLDFERECEKIAFEKSRQNTKDTLFE